VVIRQETNVRLPACAVEALGRIVARRRVSRDEALRQILGEHVADQETCDPDDRLTHISTVLRYPAPPRGRQQPRTDLPVRLRLDPGMIERVRAVSLLLPGQSRRAYRDYQARLLTDAVMTAIAVRERFTDEFLDDLLPLLRHRAVFGFWRLVVAVSSTPSELAVCDLAETIRSESGSRELRPSEQRLLLVEEALAEESWHAPERFVIAANLARVGLSGPGAEREERVLYEQGKEWNGQRLDLRRAPKSRWFVGVQGTDWSGRGGAAVWRAERRVEVGDFEDWLMSQPGEDKPRSCVVSPPGWSVEMPAGWQACVLPTNREVPARFRQWTEAGRVMLIQIPSRNKQVVWPLQPRCASPVPGVEPLVAIARELRPEQIINFIEAVLVAWGTGEDCDEESEPEEELPGPVLPGDAEFQAMTHEEEEEFWASFFDEGREPDLEVDPPGSLPLVDPEFDTLLRREEPAPRGSAPPLLVPVDQAFKFGFVTAEERRTAMADARAYTIGMPHRLFTYRPKVPHPVSTDDPRFRLLLTRRRTGQSAKPMWVWPGRSVAAEIGTDTSAQVISWLATWANWMAKRTLQRSMEQAWHAGFDHHPASYWHQVPPADDAPDHLV
jgi:hypothetical protein